MTQRRDDPAGPASRWQVAVAEQPIAFRGGRFARASRQVPEECAVAISVNGSTHAVMMATPRDLEDLAVGLALAEGIVAAPSEIERLEVEEQSLGVECRLWLSPERAATYTARRRLMTGPVGCGLCGVESLELAGREIPAVGAQALRIAPAAIVRAMADMSAGQSLGARTRAVHAAGHADADGTLTVLREDVGRHNALDKVAGHMAREALDPRAGFAVVTSRVSVELIQKAAAMSVGLLAAVSAPTALAIRAAAGAGITLVAVVRGEEFEIFTHPARIPGAGDA